MWRKIPFEWLKSRFNYLFHVSPNNSLQISERIKTNWGPFLISVQSCSSQHENHIWLGCRLCSKEYFPQIFGPEPNTHSDAVSRWAGWALAHPELRSSINPIPTRVEDYNHHITTCPHPLRFLDGTPPLLPHVVIYGSTWNDVNKPFSSKFLFYIIIIII